MLSRTAICAVVLLTGCTTTIREIRRDPPRATYQSSRSVAALVQCLSGNLSWAGTPAAIAGETSTELSFGGPGGTAVLITLRAANGGSSVEVREKLTYGARVRHNVEACVTGRDV